MNRPKNQHWVPQFYLRHFATPESRATDQPQVWIFSKDDADGDEVLTNVRNVCGKRYLYSPIGEAGERVWNLEKKLEGLESSMSEIWPSLAEDYVDLADESIRKGVSLFIATLHLRNPEARKRVEQIHRGLVSLYERAATKADGSPNIDFIEISGQAISLQTDGWNEYRSWGKNEHDQFFADTVESEATHIAKMLMGKRWSIICSATDVFITSDDPVVLQHQSRTAFGFGTPDSIVTFPLGPKRLLVIDDMRSKPPNQYHPLRPSSAGAFNFGIFRCSGRFMITGRPVPTVLAEIVAWTDRCADETDEDA